MICTTPRKPCSRRTSPPARPALSSKTKLVDEAASEMLDLQEARVLHGGLVHPKRPHDSQRGRALERADESRVSIEEIRLTRPQAHLAGVQEETAGMRVRRPVEANRNTQKRAREPGNLVRILIPRRHAPGDVSVNVRLGHEAERTHFVAVRLEQHTVAKLHIEPRQLLKEPRIAADQVILQVDEEVVLAEPLAQHRM